MLDAAVFKRLANNDTEAAVGHQGGIVIPKDLAPFFPPIRGEATPANPTLDVRLKADLFVDGTLVGTANPRYQYQTWGGTRSPERRLTDQLGPIRSRATADDIVLFVKDLEDETQIQIHLLRKGTPLYAKVAAMAGRRRWGALDPSNPPVTQNQLVEAEKYIEEESAKEGSIFREDTNEIETRTTRIARDRAFRAKVLEIYDYRCAFTGRKFESPTGLFGLDAAHIVPVDKMGSDHLTNGIALSKDVHWAFDKGLMGVRDDRRIVVPKSVAAIAGNEYLAALDGVKIREATDGDLRASPDAFRWHMQNTLVP